MDSKNYCCRQEKWTGSIKSKSSIFVVTSITVDYLKHGLLLLSIRTFLEILSSSFMNMLQYKIPLIYLVHWCQNIGEKKAQKNAFSMEYDMSRFGKIFFLTYLTSLSFDVISNIHGSFHKYRSENHQKQPPGMFLEISQNSQKNTCARMCFLIKLQDSDLQLY